MQSVYLFGDAATREDVICVQLMPQLRGQRHTTDASQRSEETCYPLQDERHVVTVLGGAQHKGSWQRHAAPPLPTLAAKERTRDLAEHVFVKHLENCEIEQANHPLNVACFSGNLEPEFRKAHASKHYTEILCSDVFVQDDNAPSL